MSGLTADDFEVIESGRPVAITTFEAVDIPIERAESIERQLSEPDVVTNDGPPGRVYLFALDEVQEANILRTRRVVRQFIEEHFGPNDIGAVALLGRGLATDGQDFTGNRRLLLGAVDKFTGGLSVCATPGPNQLLPRSIRDDKFLGLPRQAPAGAPASSVQGQGNASDSDRVRQAAGNRDQIASLRSLTEAMARVPGRHKAMIVFSECLDFDATELVDYNGGVLSLRGNDAHAAMTAATRSNIAIYPIDPTGNSSSFDGTGFFPAMRLEAIGAFNSLAAATGGFALINSNGFTEAFERIVRDNSTYYMLGFNSAYDRDDGKYVRLAVKVKRPGLTVRAREGYVAPTRDERLARQREQAKAPDSALATALATPMATGGIPLRVFATPFKGPGKNATVAMGVELEAASLGLTEQQGALRGDFNVHYLATDARRNVYPEVARTATVVIKSSGGPVPLERVRVHVLSELDLPAGRYQVRIAAGTSSLAGSLVYDLEVPDFTEKPLAMSGIGLVTAQDPNVLTIQGGQGGGGKPAKCYTERCATPAAAASKPTQAASPSQPRLPGPPTIRREFAANEEVTLVVEAYDNAPRGTQPPPVITIAAELRGADGRMIPLASEQRSAAQGTDGTHAVALRLPLADVAEGAYVLRVQARSSADTGKVVTREIPIRIR